MFYLTLASESLKARNSSSLAILLAFKLENTPPGTGGTEALSNLPCLPLPYEAGLQHGPLKTL